MADTLDLWIDLNSAGLDLDEEEMEGFAQGLATDLKDGLAEDAELVRGRLMMAGKKSAGAGFDL